jgi:hypothetical protein
MNDNERNFHMEEFKQLKTEVYSFGNSAISLVQYTLLGTVVIFSWLITQGLGIESSVACLKIPLEILTFSWYIPSGFSIMAAFGAIILLYRVLQLGSYLKELEYKLGNSELGWEKYLSGNKALLFGLAGIMFWVVLICANIWIASKINAIIKPNNTHYCTASKSSS